MQSASELVASAKFKALIAKRWRVSVVLSLLLFCFYYGFLLLIAYQKPLITQLLLGKMPLGIPLGAGVIVLSWLLTAFYVIWANRYYDPVVKALVAEFKEEAV